MKRILVAVQDEALAVFLCEELMEEAYEVLLCSDAVTFIRDIRKEKPHLVLIDEEFGGGQKALLHRNIRTLLQGRAFIILWRGNKPFSLPGTTDDEGFVLRGFNLANLKRRIQNVLGEAPPHVPETRKFHSGLLIQTEFRWVEAD